MGNDTGNGKSEPKFEWERVGNENGVEIFKRKEDGALAEKRTVNLDGRYSMDTENNIYDFRRTNTVGLVKVYETELVEEANDPRRRNQSLSNLCKCNDSVRLSVYSERIQYRLSELPQLTFPESLQFLKQTLNSYDVIYNRMGPLHINPELIGVNSLGEIKVWVNENWAVNHPSHLIPTLKSAGSKTHQYDQVSPQLRDQSEMISNLINVIEDKTEEGHFPNNFGEKIRAKASNFRETRKFLNSYITEDFKNYVPDIIKRSRVTLEKQQAQLYKQTSGSVFNKPTISVNPSTNSLIHQLDYKKSDYFTPFSQLKETKNNINVGGTVANINFKNDKTYASNIPLPSFNWNPAPVSSQWTNSAEPSSLMTFGSTIPQSNYNFGSQPLNAKPYESSFKDYSSITYKANQPSFSNQKIGFSSQEARLFPELKFNLFTNNDNKQPTAQPPKPAAQQNVVSSIETPSSPLYSLNKFLSHNSEHEHQAIYKIGGNIGITSPTDRSAVPSIPSAPTPVITQ